MNGPPPRMEAPGLRGATLPADFPSSRGRAGSLPRGAGRGAPKPAAKSNGSPGGAGEDCGAGRSLDSLPCVREKVLFLLHPERGLGTQGDPAREAAAGGEDRTPAGGAGAECPSPHLPRGKRISGGRADAAPPKSVLVRVEDYQVTQEVLCTAWTKGCMTARTEERSMTVLTFRANKE